MFVCCLLLGLISGKEEVSFGPTLGILSEENSLTPVSTEPEKEIVVSQTEDTDFNHMEFYVASEVSDVIALVNSDENVVLFDGRYKV